MATEMPSADHGSYVSGHSALTDVSSVSVTSFNMALRTAVQPAGDVRAVVESGVDARQASLSFNMPLGQEAASQTKISSLSFCFNMVLSITGSAVLGVGAQMKVLGWVMTPALLFLASAMTSELVYLVSETILKMQESKGEPVVAYQDYAYAALGMPGWWASSVTTTFSLVGMIIGGLILESQGLQVALPLPNQGWPLGGDEALYGRKWWAVLLTSTTLLYSFVDVGELLHKAGFIGVALTILSLFFVYIGTFDQVGELQDFNSNCMDGNDLPYHSFGLQTSGSTSPFEAFLGIFASTSYMVFIFAIVITLPTVQSTMQKPQRAPRMSTIAFFIVAFEFLISMMSSYWLFGNLGPQNLAEAMRHDRPTGWWAMTMPWETGKPSFVGKALSWCITVHLLCSDAIYIPCTIVAVEALLPKHLVKRRSVWLSLRFFVAFIRLFIATVITDFVKLTNLTSAAFVTTNNVLIPIIAFYRSGPKEKAGALRWALHIIIFAFGVCNMVFGTIGAVRDLVADAAEKQSPGVFPRSGISEACIAAYHNAVGS